MGDHSLYYETMYLLGNLFCTHNTNPASIHLGNIKLSFRFFFLFFSNMPEREDDHLTPATRLLEKRREMAEVEQALAAQKEVILI